MTVMSEENEQKMYTLTDELMEEMRGLLVEAGKAGFLERDFFIDIDEIEIEFVGPIPRLTGRIEINLKAPHCYPE